MAKKSREWPPVGERLPAPVMDDHTHLPVHEGEIPTAQGVKLPLVEQLGRAQEVGVSEIITVGCQVRDWAATLELARAWPQVRAALAIHPNDAAIHAGHLDKSPDGHTHEREVGLIGLDEALQQLAPLLSDPEVVAVGETGLDFFRTAGPGREAQRASFIAHLVLARENDLPLQIHDRDAHGETLEVLREAASPSQEIVFHCFSGDRGMAEEVAAAGWYASFAGPLTYPANDELRRAFLAMPRELVLVETDAPYLTPVPFRGSPNASYVMPNTVAEMARLWEEPLEVACRILMENSRRVYGAKWDQSAGKGANQ